MKPFKKLICLAFSSFLILTTGCSTDSGQNNTPPATSYPPVSTPSSSSSESSSSDVGGQGQVAAPDVKVLAADISFKTKRENDEDTFEFPEVKPETGESTSSNPENAEPDYDTKKLFYGLGSSRLVLKKLTDVTVSGSFIELDYADHEACFIKGSTLSIKAKMEVPKKIYDEKEYEYSLYEDEKVESILGKKVGKIKSGGILIQKSFDNGLNWDDEFVSYVDADGKTITYTPSGTDINRGVLLRFVSAVKLKTQKYVTEEYWEWFQTKTREVLKDFYVVLMQTSTVYVGSNIIGAGFYSEDTKYDGEVPEGYTTEILNSVSTLSDGSVSFTPVTYKNNGQPTLTCRYKYNGGEMKYATNEQVFSEPGKYEFIINNVIGTTKEMTIYVVDEKTLFKSYFGDGMLPNNRRIYNEQSTIPCYMLNTTLNFNSNSNLPPVYAEVYKVTNGKANETPYAKIAEKYLKEGLVMDEVSTFAINMLIGASNTKTQMINYQFFFNIIDEPDYKPTVNYNLLKGSFRKLNLKTTAYATNFETTKGGSYVFLFPMTLKGYKQATDFAYDMEKRYIHTFTDNDGNPYYYYHGTRYDSKVDLFLRMEEILKDAVYTSYINPAEPYAIGIIEEDKLANIENTVLDEDVRVCVNLETRNALVSDDIIINGFKFTQVADYETSSLRVEGVGVNTAFNYEIDMDKILTTSGKYVITEANWNSSRSIEVTFIKPGENTGVINFTSLTGETETKYSVKQSTEPATYSGDVLLFNKSIDELDSQTIVTVSCPAIGYRESSLLSEINTDIPFLTEKGTYTVTVINRLGYSFSFNFEITGNYVPEEGED